MNKFSIYFILGTLLISSPVFSCEGEQDFQTNFQAFSVEHPDLDTSVQGVRDNADHYPQGLDETKIRLYALCNFWGSQLSGVEDALNSLIQVNQYKNFPNEAEHAANICAFSRHHKPVVEEVRSLLKGSQTRQDSMYGEIATADDPNFYITLVGLSLTVIDRANQIIAGLPSLDDFQPPAPAPDPIQAFLDTDGFELQVLNLTATLYRREGNPLNAQMQDQREACAQAIIELSPEQAGWRNDARFGEKIRQILEENFGE